jgi:hypothetical protein
MNTPVTSVAEMQGLYGAYSFSEHLLQKIWLRGDFDRERAVTVEGERVKILHPGQWNRLGGPDFKNARLQLGAGPEVVGDVELHLHAEDWHAHGHARDAAYDRVGLHVVLFPPGVGRFTRGNDGRKIPVLSLLTLLQHDLEEFAADEAIERLAARPAGRIVEELGLLAPTELTERLQKLAEMRWKQKVRFARMRVQRLGWNGACHQTALEIMGYRFNRSPMLRLAGRFPLEAWSNGAVNLESALAAESESWSLQGVRPANQPRTRIAQYLEWTQQRPDWPGQLVALAETWLESSAGISTRAMRRAHRVGDWRKRFADEICGGAIGGSRLDTLIVDGFFPLLASQSSTVESGFFGGWFHWFPGDLPPLVPRALRDLVVVSPKHQPAINGFAQGLLGWWWQREAGSATVEGRGA